MEWHDPFAEDEAAAERERRRAEREAKRQARRRSLGEKVGAGEEQGAGETPGSREPEPAPSPKPAPTPAPSATASSPPPPPQRPASQPSARRPGGSGGGGGGALWLRRILGVAALIAGLVVLVLGAQAVKGVFDGDDSAPAAPVKPVKTSEFTIPEGYDRHQIADLAKEAGIKGDYEQESKSFKGFDPAEYGAEDPPNLEGFLFPALYELPKKATVKDLIAKQLSEGFEAHMAEVDLSYAKSKNLNAYDVLKIASMIEREIQVPEERELAAAVIYNRLAVGDTLGIDATIRYYLQNYDEQLTESELADPHPYNTRINGGLPPTPIGNPGLASIEAAANPAKSDAYFFVVKPGTCGEHVFVETEEEFEQAEAEYQQALAEQGGSPTEC